MYIYYVLSIDLEADFTIMKKQKLLHSWTPHIHGAPCSHGAYILQWERH